jgi:hypothetical protein
MIRGSWPNCRKAPVLAKQEQSVPQREYEPIEVPQE